MHDHQTHDARAPAATQEWLLRITVDTDRDDLTSALWHTIIHGGLHSGLGDTCGEWPDDPLDADFTRVLLYRTNAAPRPRKLVFLDVNGAEIGAVDVRAAELAADPEERLKDKIARLESKISEWVHDREMRDTCRPMKLITVEPLIHDGPCGLPAQEEVIDGKRVTVLVSRETMLDDKIVAALDAASGAALNLGVLALGDRGPDEDDPGAALIPEARLAEATQAVACIPFATLPDEQLIEPVAAIHVGTTGDFLFLTRHLLPHCRDNDDLKRKVQTIWDACSKLFRRFDARSLDAVARFYGWAGQRLHSALDWPEEILALHRAARDAERRFRDAHTAWMKDDAPIEGLEQRHRDDALKDVRKQQARLEDAEIAFDRARWQAAEDEQYRQAIAAAFPDKPRQEAAKDVIDRWHRALDAASAAAEAITKRWSAAMAAALDKAQQRQATEEAERQQAAIDAQRRQATEEMQRQWQSLGPQQGPASAPDTDDHPPLDMANALPTSIDERRLAEMIVKSFAPEPLQKKKIQDIDLFSIPLPFRYWHERWWLCPEDGCFREMPRGDGEAWMHGFISKWVQDHVEGGKVKTGYVRNIEMHLRSLCLLPRPSIFDLDPAVLLFLNCIAVLPWMSRRTRRILVSLGIDPVRDAVNGIVRCAPSPLFFCSMRLGCKLGDPRKADDLDGFLLKISGGRKDRARVKKELGARCFVADPHGSGFFVIFGPSNSGKSTFVEDVILAALGDRGCPVSYKMFVANTRSGSEHKADEAATVGKWAVICDEAQADARQEKISTTWVKLRSRRHKVPVRDAYGRAADMKTPQCGTYILATNKRPDFTYRDQGLQNRWRLIVDDEPLDDPPGRREETRALIESRLPDWVAAFLEVAARTHGAVSETDTEADDRRAWVEEIDEGTKQLRQAVDLALEFNARQFHWKETSAAIEAHVRTWATRRGLSEITNLTENELKDRLADMLPGLGALRGARVGKKGARAWRFVCLRPLPVDDFFG